MHVGIANPRLRGKRYRHSRRMRNPQFYVSGKRPMNLATIKSIFADDIPTMPGVSTTPFWDWTGGSAQMNETTRSWAQKNLDNGKRKALLMASFSYNLLGTLMEKDEYLNRFCDCVSVSYLVSQFLCVLSNPYFLVTNKTKYCRWRSLTTEG